MKKLFILFLVICAVALVSADLSNLSSGEKEEIAADYYMVGLQYIEVGEKEKGQQFIDMAYQLDPDFDPDMINQETGELKEAPEESGDTAADQPEEAAETDQAGDAGESGRGDTQQDGYDSELQENNDMQENNDLPETMEEDQEDESQNPGGEQSSVTMEEGIITDSPVLSTTEEVKMAFVSMYSSFYQGKAAETAAWFAPLVVLKPFDETIHNYELEQTFRGYFDEGLPESRPVSNTALLQTTRITADEEREGYYIITTSLNKNETHAFFKNYSNFVFNNEATTDRWTIVEVF